MGKLNQLVPQSETPCFMFEEILKYLRGGGIIKGRKNFICGCLEAICLHLQIFS